MKGYTIQNSIDLLEKAIENGGGSGGASTAADVTYDNTTSGLEATNVQSAVDEVAASVSANTGAISTLSGAIDTINSKSIKFGTPVAETISNLNTQGATHTFVNGGIAAIQVSSSGSSDGYCQIKINDVVTYFVLSPSGYVSGTVIPVNAGDQLKISALSTGISINAINVVPLEFVAPAAPESNTRKKK